jgi:hypothetical protein
MADIFTRLLILESQGLVVFEEVIRHRALLDSLFAARVAAMGTSEDEKLEALRNAVLNTALGPDDHNPARVVFVQYVVRFDAWHIRYLKFFEDPVGLLVAGRWRTEAIPEYVAIDSIMRQLYPESEMHRDTSVSIVNELMTAGLVQVKDSRHVRVDLGPEGPQSESPIVREGLTPYGKRFLGFISEPDPGENE